MALGFTKKGVVEGESLGTIDPSSLDSDSSADDSANPKPETPKKSSTSGGDPQ